MANFDTTGVTGLIGLWDFKAGNENADTGLDDGKAQDGTFERGASAVDDRLVLDHTSNSDPEYFDVDADKNDDDDDGDFALSKGVIEVQFNQAQQLGSSADVIVSRGEFDDRDDEGSFEIRALPDGVVEVFHQTEDGKATLTSSKNFFTPGDDVNVKYSFDEATGAQLVLENLSTGATETLTTSQTGLHLDITDDDDEQFTFGAREKDDGEYDKAFKGTIDYVAVYEEAVADPKGDGYVEGTSGDDLIDVNYEGDPEGDKIDNGDALLPGEGPDDDIVLALDGDDTVKAGEGDDDVYGGAGEDTLHGGVGNDRLYGDVEGPAREFLDWEALGKSDNQNVGNFTQDTGTTEVHFKILDSGADRGDEFSTDTQNVDHIDTGPTGGDADANSSFESELVKGEDTSAAYELGFDQPVQNVSFRINDVDGDGKVTVKAFDENGDPVEVELTLDDMTRLTASDTDGVPGIDTVEGDGNYLDDTDGEYSVLVGIAGPVSKIVIEHSQTGSDNSGINFTNLYFDAGLVDAGAFDDTIKGDEGDDLLVGNGGNDDLDGGTGDDTILGGDGNDDITGGAGNDTVEGGDGDDHIVTGGALSDELPDVGFGGAGAVPPIPADPDPNNDRDFVDGGAGNDTIFTGDDEDTILGGAGQDTIDGGLDDDTIDGGDDDDFIVGGEGDDTIQGGDGNDTIYGGLNPIFPDSLNIIDDPVDGSAPDPNPGGAANSNGDDIIDGGDGDDRIFGQDDDDTIRGGSGDDFIDGGIDDDHLRGQSGNDTIIGGQGADGQFGAADRDTFIVDDVRMGSDGKIYSDGIGDEITGGEDGDDFDTLNLDGAGPLRVVLDEDLSDADKVDPTGTPGEAGRVFFYDGNGFDDANIVGELTFKEIENVIPCFTLGSLIATPRGEVPVEQLKVGDTVITRDNGIQEIRWIGTRAMSGRDLIRAPQLRPILIKKGALGDGLPERDMMVSPQHRMLVSNERTHLFFDESEVLVAAKHLVDHKGILWAQSLGTTYVHFMFDQHEVVLADGSWTESFQPGDVTLGSMGETQRNEIFQIFPGLREEAGVTSYHAARRALKSHEARLLVR